MLYRFGCSCHPFTGALASCSDSSFWKRTGAAWSLYRLWPSPSDVSGAWRHTAVYLQHIEVYQGCMPVRIVITHSTPKLTSVNITTQTHRSKWRSSGTTTSSCRIWLLKMSRHAVILCHNYCSFCRSKRVCY